MWPFRAKTSRETGTPPDPTLEIRLAELERQLREIEVEWSEWFDKYRRLYARIAKRVQRDEKDAQDDRHATNGVEREETPQRAARRSLRGF